MRHEAIQIATASIVILKCSSDNLQFIQPKRHLISDKHYRTLRT